MSSIGRTSARIDLNSSTISAIAELKDRIDVLDIEVGDEKIIQPPTPSTGLFLKIDNVENNVSILRTDTDKLQQQVGNDDIDPKTGIFLRLFDIEKADSIIPYYDYQALYYILLQSQYETTGNDYCNIKIDNSENSNLNDILLNIQKDVEILKQHKDLTRHMINQSGFRLLMRS